MEAPVTQQRQSAANTRCHDGWNVPVNRKLHSSKDTAIKTLTVDNVGGNLTGEVIGHL